MLMATCCVLLPGGMCPGQRTSAGIRKPPSKKLSFLAGERPGIGEALAAVVAGENDDSVVCDARDFQRLQDPAHLQIHFSDHPGIRLHRAAVVVD